MSLYWDIRTRLEAMKPAKLDTDGYGSSLTDEAWAIVLAVTLSPGDSMHDAGDFFHRHDERVIERGEERVALRWSKRDLGFDIIARSQMTVQRARDELEV